MVSLENIGFDVAFVRKLSVERAASDISISLNRVCPSPRSKAASTEPERSSKGG